MSESGGVVNDQNTTEECTIEETMSADLAEALDRLDMDGVGIDEDLEIPDVTKKDSDHEDNVSDTQSQGTDSSSGVAEEKGSVCSGQDDSTESTKPKNTTKGKDKDKRRGSFVLDKLKKLTKFDKPKHTTPAVPTPSSKFQTIRVDKLPQVFVAKYLGKKEVNGLFGLHHVRKPVDELVRVVKDGLLANKKVELPLAYVVVSGRGIDIREHKSNTVKEQLVCGLVPIDFISYGVQDLKYWKVFTFIVVNQLSSRTKETECHAFLCDSPANCRRMALSLGASFSVYKQKLASQGKAHNFQVELRPPDELAGEFEKDFEA